MKPHGDYSPHGGRGWEENHPNDIWRGRGWGKFLSHRDEDGEALRNGEFPVDILTLDVSPINPCRLGW